MGGGGYPPGKTNQPQNATSGLMSAWGFVGFCGFLWGFVGFCGVLRGFEVSMVFIGFGVWGLGFGVWGLGFGV